jgi:hypothetical protein
VGTEPPDLLKFYYIRLEDFTIDMIVLIVRDDGTTFVCASTEVRGLGMSRKKILIHYRE